MTSIDALRQALEGDEAFRIDWSDTAVALVRHVPTGEDRYISSVAELEEWRQRLHNQEPTMVRCPYCGNMHQADQVENCVLKPRQ